MKQPPASIRYNNPGAQYPGPSAKRFGSTGTEIIGGGHKIAVFDDPVKGAAAQFDLLSRAYAGMSLQDAIRKWSGGNSSDAYAQHISRATGIPLDGLLTRELLSDPTKAIPLAKTAADWEAGGNYPMSGEQWSQAFQMAQGGPLPAILNVAAPVAPVISNAAPEPNAGLPGIDGDLPLGTTAQPQFGSLRRRADPNAELADLAMQEVSQMPQMQLTGRRMGRAPDITRIRQAVRGRLGITGA